MVSVSVSVSVSYIGFSFSCWFSFKFCAFVPQLAAGTEGKLLKIEVRDDDADGRTEVFFCDFNGDKQFYAWEEITTDREDIADDPDWSKEARPAEYVRIVQKYEDDESGNKVQTDVIIDYGAKDFDVEYGPALDEGKCQQETDDLTLREDFWPELAAEAADLSSAGGGGHVLKLLEVRGPWCAAHTASVSKVSVLICGFGFRNSHQGQYLLLLLLLPCCRATGTSTKTKDASGLPTSRTNLQPRHSAWIRRTLKR